MGKSAQLKKLRRLASQLPAVATNQKMHTLIQGHNLHIEKDKDGKAIEPGKIYSVEKTLPVNHLKKMKENYNKAGMAGAALYARSVIEHVRQKNAITHNS